MVELESAIPRKTGVTFYGTAKQSKKYRVTLGLWLKTN